MTSTEDEADEGGKAVKKRRKRRRAVLMRRGQMNGYLLLLKRARAPRDAAPSTKKRWTVRCTAPNCGKEFDVPETYMRRKNNPKEHCGCLLGSLRSKYNNTYRIWLMVRERTRNPEHVANIHYVSRGIDIIDEWYDLATGFELFLAEVGDRPSKKYSLDRIDNARGYMPGNLRWATSAEQRANQDDCIAGLTREQLAEKGLTPEKWLQWILDNRVFGDVPELDLYCKHKDKIEK